MNIEGEDPTSMLFVNVRTTQCADDGWGRKPPHAFSHWKLPLFWNNGSYILFKEFTTKLSKR
jgi:hypothetical protein